MSTCASVFLPGKERNYNGENFWARGYAVSTFGFELSQIRNYIREQEEQDTNEPMGYRRPGYF